MPLQFPLSVKPSGIDQNKFCGGKLFDMSKLAKVVIAGRGLAVLWLLRIHYDSPSINGMWFASNKRMQESKILIS